MMVTWYLAALAITAGLACAAFIICSVSRKGLWPRLAAHILVYGCDIGMAVLGFTMGFGLEVKNWWWLVLPMVFGRFTFHILRRVLDVTDERGRK